MENKTKTLLGLGAIAVALYLILRPKGANAQDTNTPAIAPHAPMPSKLDEDFGIKCGDDEQLVVVNCVQAPCPPSYCVKKKEFRTEPEKPYKEGLYEFTDDFDILAVRDKPTASASAGGMRINSAYDDFAYNRSSDYSYQRNAERYFHFKKGDVVIVSKILQFSEEKTYGYDGDYVSIQSNWAGELYISGYTFNVPMFYLKKVDDNTKKSSVHSEIMNIIRD
jgi:hypothetical protein